MRSGAESVHLIAATVGFFSFLFLWLAAVSGMVLRNSWAPTIVRHATVYSVHMVLALLGVCLGVVHALAQLANPTGAVAVDDVLVPFVHPVDPIGIGVGVIGLELLVALTLSVLIQRRLGYTRWRHLHVLAYATFMFVVAHVLISGTDTSSPLVWWLVFSAWLVTVALWVSSTQLPAAVRRWAGRLRAERSNERVLSVDVDAVRCARFGFCEHEAPQVFHLRGDGHLSYPASVSASDAERVIRAAEVCPARAIALKQASSEVYAPRRLAVVPELTPLGATESDGDAEGRHGAAFGPRTRHSYARRGDAR